MYSHVRCRHWVLHGPGICLQARYVLQLPPGLLFHLGSFGFLRLRTTAWCGFKRHSHNLVSPEEPYLWVGWWPLGSFYERRLEEFVVFILIKVKRRFDIVSKGGKTWVENCYLNGRQMCLKWTLMNLDWELENLEFSEQWGYGMTFLHGGQEAQLLWKRNLINLEKCLCGVVARDSRRLNSKSFPILCFYLMFLLMLISRIL